VRYAATHFDFRNFSDGPQNFGPDSGSGSEGETPITFMAGITVNSSEDDMQYLSYSSGYRIGGANPPFPEASCQADLEALGLDHVPETYDSDRVTNLELGTKDKLLGGRLQLGASVYHLTWSKIQQANYLSSCGFQYIANFGSAVSRGFDLEADWLVTDDIEVHASLGYMDAHYSTDSLSGTGAGAAIIARRGDALPGSPWSFAIDVQYGFSLAGLNAFVRLDDEFASHNRRPTPLMDPATTQYDPGLVNDPAVNILSLRLGTTIQRAAVTLFAENLLDSQPQLNLDRMDKYTLLYEASTLRPRTVGLTVSYRY
jgi:iron complex outermembrane recepter protein